MEISLAAYSFSVAFFFFSLYELHDSQAVISFLYFSTNNRLVSHCLLRGFACCLHEYLLAIRVFQMNNVVIRKDKAQNIFLAHGKALRARTVNAEKSTEAEVKDPIRNPNHRTHGRDCLL